jgi:hypothetical protein
MYAEHNGPEATHPWQGSSGPWRGYYFTHMEGSLRVIDWMSVCQTLRRWHNVLPRPTVLRK